MKSVTSLRRNVDEVGATALTYACLWVRVCVDKEARDLGILNGKGGLLEKSQDHNEKARATRQRRGLRVQDRRKKANIKNQNAKKLPSLQEWY